LPLSLSKRTLQGAWKSNHIGIRCAIQLGNRTHWDMRFSIDGKCEALRGIPQLDGKINDQRDLCPSIKESAIAAGLSAAPPGKDG
jgi:hypothetical protein